MAFRHKPLILALAAALTLGFASDVSARVGGGSSFGSRGARTFSAPSATPLAPRAAPMDRSMSSPNEGIFRRPSAFGQQGGFFSGGFGRGLLGGFIGAGLFGMLFGNGLFGGLGGGMSILGLLLQIGLLFLLFKLVMGFVRGRPAFQGAGFAPGQGMGQGRQGQSEGRHAGLAAAVLLGRRPMPSLTSRRQILASSSSGSWRLKPRSVPRILTGCGPWRRRKWPLSSLKNSPPTPKKVL